MKSFTNLLLKLFSLIFLSLSFQKNVSAQTTVVIAGDFQSELGCTGDWMPDCDATRLIQTSPGIWEGTIEIPAGIWEYKVTYDNSWNENYGQGGEPGGPNILLGLIGNSSVHFSYSSNTHLVSTTTISTGISLAGDFQNELGCPGDWMADCDISNLVYSDNNILFGIFAIPPGNWQFKVTHNNSWTENYGLNGELNGANIPLTVSGDKKTLFRYDPFTHIVTTTPVDNSVVLAGDFQSELGCPGDWQPDCPLTGLAFDPGNNLWKGDFFIPAGNWQFKVTVDGSWAENYGEGGVPGGPNILLNLATASKVSFVYNPDTHMVQVTIESITVVIPGSFQTELGCATDWDPACDNTRLTYDDAKQVWTGTFDIPAGNWEFKVALNNSWAENYGEGGIPGGQNMPLNLELPANITFIYDPLTHIVTLQYNTTSLCIVAFYDANANGFKDYQEDILMESVAFTLSGEGTQYTDSNGKTCFGGLTPGLYTLQGIIPPGYLSTTVDSQTVDLTQPQTIHFGIVCLGGAGAENIAFWMNKKGSALFESLADWQQSYILSALRYLNLRNSDGSDFDPRSYVELRTWLQKANAKNMAYKLSAQMATLFLNAEVKQLSNRMIYTPGVNFLGIGYNFMEVGLFIQYANQNLFENAFGGDSNRIYQQFLYDLMVHANNDSTFVQLQPCGVNEPKSAMIKRPQERDNNISATPIEIWPNPSGNQFNLRISNITGEGKVQVRVLDVHGRQVYTYNGSNLQVYRFGENFIPGLYFVEVTQGSKRSNFKIIKQ